MPWPIEARVVILDEPTAALSQAEIRDFYGLVRGLKAQGVELSGKEEIQ